MHPSPASTLLLLGATLPLLLASTGGSVVAQELAPAGDAQATRLALHTSEPIGIPSLAELPGLGEQIGRYPSPVRLSEAQRKGLSIGGQVGALAGLGVGYWIARREGDGELPGLLEAFAYSSLGAVIGGVGGAGVGLLIGTLVDGGEVRPSVGVRLEL